MVKIRKLIHTNKKNEGDENVSNYRTWIEISERALIQNIETLKNASDKSKFCAVVKANAYGHGLKEIAQIANKNGVNFFAVDNIDDALLLRKLLPSSTILTLGYTMKDRLSDAIQDSIDITVYDKDTIELIEKEATKLAKKINVHLKIETGTARQGVLKKNLPETLQSLKRAKHLHLNGISTHFANLEETHNTEFASEQIKKFSDAISSIKKEKFNPSLIHCACSAGIILYPETHFSMVRAGISLYGIWPSYDVKNAVITNNLKIELKPVLTWKSRIAQIKEYAAGTPIGYGLTEKLQKRSRIAVVPVGYWDGYDRGLSSKGEVLVGGVLCNVIGRVCMNMIMIDVSMVPNIHTEQEVILIGTEGKHMISAYNIADKINTIGYEILTRINPTLPRIIV